jgi:hypothetical protein
MLRRHDGQSLELAKDICRFVTMRLTVVRSAMSRRIWD